MAKERLFGGRWKVTGNLREGGQGWIYRVVDTAGEFTEEYALKRLKNKERIGRFRTEVDVLKRLNDPHIIKLIDASVSDNGNESYLVMPIAAHGDLGERIWAYASQIDSVVQVALQVAKALDHAHNAGVIHRDIKPGNILFPELNHDVWVADFGISLDLEASERNTADGEVVGPRTFVAPELTEAGPVDVTAAADVYSLGQLVFYMFSGGSWLSQTSVLDARYDHHFAGGERHQHLRMLLSKMVVPLVRRYTKMTPVVRDLEQIRDWEKARSSSLLDAEALGAAARLQRRVTERAQGKARFEEVRRSEWELIDSVSKNVAQMLFDTLSRQASVLDPIGALGAVAELNEPKGRQQIKIDTGIGSLFEERDVASLTIRSDPDARRFSSLRLLVCNEVFHARQPSDELYLGPPGNPSFAIVPMYSENSGGLPNAGNEVGYIYGKSKNFGVRETVPIMSAPRWYPKIFGYQYQEGITAVVRFNGRDWPAATDEILSMVSETLNRMIRHVEQQM
ncbi:serine/threonine protein kinase [Bradyrhizobium sp. LB12.1]|uniref:serine/threonine protein kinase n=1 Tax=Bradyrhizobium sp. LB12.1 TaxID=3156327 RepID=UPI0033967F06